MRSFWSYQDKFLFDVFFVNSLCCLLVLRIEDLHAAWHKVAFSICKCTRLGRFFACMLAGHRSQGSLIDC